MGRFSLTILCAAVFAVLQLSSARALEAVLEENFGSNSQKYFYEGVLDDRVFSYIDGEYEIDTTGSSAYGQSVVMEEFSTYHLEARGRLAAATSQEAGFGLSFNYRDGNNDNEFLLFLVYDRGAYTILKYMEGRTQILAAPKPTKLFKRGESVLLGVDSIEGELAFYINGAEVTRLREGDLTSGGVGMFATAGAVVRFDNFLVAADVPDPGFSEYSFDTGTPLPEGEWSGIDYGYQNGAYVIDTLGTDYVGLSPFDEQAFDFEFSVDAWLLDGDPLNGYGIYIRDFSNEDGGFNQFRFLVAGGWFAVERSEGERPLALTEWAKHPAISENGINRLKVIAVGGSLQFIINGVEVWRGADPEPREGSFGLYAAGGLKASFDNATVRRF